MQSLGNSLRIIQMDYYWYILPAKIRFLEGCPGYFQHKPVTCPRQRSLCLPDYPGFNSLVDWQTIDSNNGADVFNYRPYSSAVSIPFAFLGLFNISRTETVFRRDASLNQVWWE